MVGGRLNGSFIASWDGWVPVWVLRQQSLEPVVIVAPVRGQCLIVVGTTTKNDHCVGTTPSMVDPWTGWWADPSMGCYGDHKNPQTMVSIPILVR